MFITSSWVGASWHVQCSSKVVGLSQCSSEHWNWQLLPPSSWHFAWFFLLASLYSNLFSLSAYTLLFCQIWACEWEYETMHYQWLAVSSTVQQRILSGCLKVLSLNNNFTWDLTMLEWQWASTFMYGTFTLSFNLDLETVRPETATAASKMGISCSINLFTRLCFLPTWLVTYIFVTAANLQCGGWNN